MENNVTMPSCDKIPLESYTRLSKDLKNASAWLSDQEARYLVDGYYIMQEQRKRLNNQVLALSNTQEPHSLIVWLAHNLKCFENQIKLALSKYADASPIGQRVQTVVGIGPVISAGLLAHIDITLAPTAGAVWRYAGLDPTQEWKKKEKRPWNASLKTLAWKIGESFLKTKNHEKSFYGPLFDERWEYEKAQNEKGLFADQAAEKLKKFKISKTTTAYKFYSKGFLPPAHILQRAKRWATKLFLSHFHEALYIEHFKKTPPETYILTAEENHVHKIECPF